MRDYLDSGIFDSFRFSGVSLVSDDNMLPPNLRGYAPEVVGVAKTNAKVTISQQGRVIYETQVAAGPFRIQDINDAISGELDVRVEEQDGSVQAFKVNTASIPVPDAPRLVALQAGRRQTFGLAAPFARAAVRHRRVLLGRQQRVVAVWRGAAGRRL